MDFFEQFASLLREIGFSGLYDIAIVTLVIYTFIIGLKRTRRSGLIFAGIVIIGTVYLMARQFNLVLTAALLQGFFTVILVALVVIFQEDLRYFFEQVATWWLVRGLPFYKRRPKRLPRQEVEILARDRAAKKNELLEKIISRKLSREGYFLRAGRWALGCVGI